MKDQHSTSDDRVAPTPESEERNYGFADYGTPSAIPPEYWAHFLDDLDEDDYGGEGRHLITVDELRAAGALDVPAAWRKSLGVECVERDLFSGLSDDDPRPEQQPSPPRDQECDTAADEPE